MYLSPAVRSVAIGARSNMLPVHHVLRCRVDGGGGKEEAWEKLGSSETPGNKDHATRFKRQRLPPTTNTGNSTSPIVNGGNAQAGGISAQPHSVDISAQPKSVDCAPAAACAAAPPLHGAAPVGHAPYPGGTPWQASLLYGYVHKVPGSAGGTAPRLQMHSRHPGC